MGGKKPHDPFATPLGAQKQLGGVICSSLLPMLLPPLCWGCREALSASL